MPSLWQGYYLDGHTAIRHPVTIQFATTALHIVKADGNTIDWPYGKITQTQGAYEGEQIRLEYGGPLPQTVIVEDLAFLTALQQAAASNAAHFHNPQQRPLRLRLTILAGIALLGVTACFYVWGIPGLATFLAPRIPVSWEEQLGASVLAQLAPSDTRCVDLNRFPALETVVARLSRAMPDSPYRIQLTVVDNPVMNAFALPGGQVVVFRGLLEATETSEQLAGVLAHELQHIYKQHPTRAIIEQASTSLLIAAVSGDFTGALAYGIEGARLLGVLRYSRLHEDEADREGLRLLQAVGIDPAEMIAFYRIMEAQHPHEAVTPSSLSTHPDTNERIETLIALAGPPPPHPVKLFSQEAWKDLRSLCRRPVAATSQIPTDTAP
ncbi:MAG: M48 family metallopeptidase [Nitrospira sp.]|nr:MAG: M48 family metallopeptidase [Nitrospira sp.]